MLREQSSSTKTTKSAQLWLDYYKQGDDMNQCIIKNEDGKIDAKASINNHIALLENVIEHLKQVNNLIPYDNDIDIDANTHHIDLNGDSEIIQKLIDAKLLNSDDEEEE